jgi:nucleotide-binding universal stress UspA family protein
MGIFVAQQGGSRLLGLHVVTDEAEAAQTVPALQAEFERRCQAAGVIGQFAVEFGAIAQRVVARSVYADGVILPMNNPPGGTAVERLTSGMQLILRKCPRPILVVPPDVKTPLTHALLAYGGQRTVTKEALFVAAYLATRYQLKLTVLSVGEPAVAEAALSEVRAYFEGAEADVDYVLGEGPVSQAIIKTAQAVQADFLMVGSFAYGPLRALLKGSTINRLLLHEECYPILICR